MKLTNYQQCRWRRRDCEPVVPKFAVQRVHDRCETLSMSWLQSKSGPNSIYFSTKYKGKERRKGKHDSIASERSSFSSRIIIHLRKDEKVRSKWHSRDQGLDKRQANGWDLHWCRSNGGGKGQVHVQHQW